MAFTPAINIYSKARAKMARIVNTVYCENNHRSYAQVSALRGLNYRVGAKDGHEVVLEETSCTCQLLCES